MICLVDWENLYIFAGESFQKLLIVLRQDRWRRTGDRSLSRKIINRSSLIHNHKQCHDKDAYNQAGESIMSWCVASTANASISKDELTALVDAPLDNDVKTVATADRNRQKHNIKFIKKIILADRTLSCPRVLPGIIPRQILPYQQTIHNEYKRYQENQSILQF